MVVQYSEERTKNLNYTQFKRLFGVSRVTFNRLKEIVKKKYSSEHKKGGRKRKLSFREMVILFLLYFVRYNSMEALAFDFNVVKSTVCDVIHWVINTILEDKNFTLFREKIVKEDDSENRLIDVTEIRIERPKYNQRNKYSGKKKYHTMKIQIIRGTETGFIYEIQIGPGSEHDFHLFKRTFDGTPGNVTYTVDLGYIGIDKVHTNTEVPKKNSKKHKLTEEEKEYNKEIAKERIFIEHTNSWIKRFSILSTRFRNNLKYFASIAVVICGFYNIEIA